MQAAAGAWRPTVASPEAHRKAGPAAAKGEESLSEEEEKRVEGLEKPAHEDEKEGEGDADPVARGGVVVPRCCCGRRISVLLPLLLLLMAEQQSPTFRSDVANPPRLTGGGAPPLLPNLRRSKRV